MIQQFNLVSGWVRTCLVTLIKKSERVEMFKRFIDLMECLKELNNFNGMMEILSGLNRFDLFGLFIWFINFFFLN